MDAGRLHAWLKAEVERTRDRVEEFERGMRGRQFGAVETGVVSLSLRLRWNAHEHAKRRLAEFLKPSEPGTAGRSELS